MRYFITRLFILVFSIAQFSGIFAQPPADKYNRIETLIPMRDGIKLNTVIFTPKDQSGPLPFLLSRTPYGVSDNPSP